MTRTILVVDDSRFDRNLVVRALSKGGFHAVEAESGDECMDALEAHDIELMLLDIVMPGENGPSILKKVRKKYNEIELPVIMTTSKSDPSDIIGCLKSGANDYITKPLNLEIALSRIVTQLRLVELSREKSRLEQIVALDAMITTYNHEINNPLTVAVGCLNRQRLLEDPDVFQRLEASIERIADIVRKIRNVTSEREVHLETYTRDTKMLKI